MNLNELVILIADDHPMIRKGLIFSLKSVGIGKEFLEAENGLQALKLARENHFDLLLSDYKMPDMTGIDLTRRLLRKKPASRVMIISSYAEPQLVMQFYRAGAKGYLEKNCGVGEIKKAISQIIDGKTYYHEALQALDEKQNEGIEPVEFTTREADLVRLIASGLNSQEIATMKALSKKTIEASRTRLFKKARVRNTAELLDYFYRNGLL